jgi:hypothetical protein
MPEIFPENIFMFLIWLSSHLYLIVFFYQYFRKKYTACSLLIRFVTKDLKRAAGNEEISIHLQYLTGISPKKHHFWNETIKNH